MNKIMLFAAACFAFAACTKDVETTTPENSVAFKKGQKVTLSVKSALSTKVSSSFDATTDSVKFKWETGDKIKVTVGSESSEFTLKTGAGTATASFEGTMPADGEQFDVQYPVTDPDLVFQTYVKDALPKDEMKMSATNCTLGDDFTLQPQYSALKLNLWGGQTVGKIVVIKTNTTDPSYTLECGNGVKVGDTEADCTAFFIVVHDGSFTISAEIYDNATTPALICNFETTDAKTFSSGEILDMPAKKILVTKGKAKRTGDVDVEWVQLWEGGPKWAGCNVGATTATDYGDYFCWGGSYANGEGKAFQDDHCTGDSDIQYGNNDTAKNKWGSNWQMPTSAQLGDLVNNTSYEWKTNYSGSGKNGHLFTGKGEYKNNSVFLPAAGFCYDGQIYGGATSGSYWGSTPNGSDNAMYVYMYNAACFTNYDSRVRASSVRAILHE